MKFPTKKQMAEVGVHNPHNLVSLTEQKVAIYWSPQITGRGYRCAHYAVIHLGFQTAPGGPWYENGNKTFNVLFETTKEKALAEAIAWTNKRYGAREWVRDPWGSYQDPSVVGLVHALIKKAKEEK